MERILNKCESTYVASWFPDVNFNHIEELYIGSYNPTIQRKDNYEILINFDLDFLSRRLYSVESAILELPYIKKLENVNADNNNDKIMIYMNNEKFDVTNVTWNNKPSHLDQGIQFSIGDTVDNRKIDVGITEIVKKWIYAQQSNCGITLVLPTNAGQSLVYFGKRISLKLKYTPCQGVFGYFQNNKMPLLNPGNTLDPGTVYEGEYVQIVKSKDNKPVIQCFLSGMYQISCIGNTVGNRFGDLSFKIGNSNQNISEFKKINNKPFIGGKQLNAEALFYVNENANQVALVAESNMGSVVEEEFYTSTIIQRKRVEDNIVLYPNNENIFAGGDLGNLSITLNVDSNNNDKVFGVDDLTTFSGELYVQGDIGEQNKIIFRNIKINGTLDLSTINGTILLENVYATNLNITSESANNIEIGTGCSFVNVNIKSQGKTYFKIAANATNVNIQNVYLAPKGVFDSNLVIFEGNFGSANIQILKALKIESKGIVTSRPIIINIVQGDLFNVELNGDFFTNYIKVISKCIVMFKDNLTKEATINRVNNASGVQIIVDSNNLDEVVQFQGNLQGAIINVISLSSIKIDTNSDIALLNISDTCKKAVVDLSNDIVIDSFKVASEVVLSGDINSIKKALTSAIVTKSTATINLDLGENENQNLVDILNASMQLQTIFIGEITGNILYKYIEDVVNQTDPDVKVIINSVTNLVPNSGSFALDNANQRINYTQLIANKDNIDLNKALLSVQLSKGQENLQKDFLLKGKYKDITINYENKSCSIDGTTFNLIEYVAKDKEISTVNFNNNMDYWGNSLKFISRNLDLNLNSHYLNLDNMWIQDGKINIQNGVINVQQNIEKWDKYASVFSFITIVKNSLYTSVNLNNVTIKASNIIPGVNMDASTKCTLISTINNTANLNNNVDILNLYNCTLKVDKNDANTNNNIKVYGINTSSISDMINNCTLTGNFNGVRIQNDVSSIFMENAFSKNNFENNANEGFRAIEVLPYKGSNGVVNGTNVNANETEEAVLSNLFAMGNALIETRGYLEPNTFKEGSRITLANDENRMIIKEIVYENGKWVEGQDGGLDAPVINPDNTDNDMMNNITLTFNPDDQWVNNIQQISVKNSKNTVLTSDKYSIDNNAGEITIFNVILNDKGVPIYQGVLEPSNNVISIYSSGYKGAHVTQFIKAIQIVEFKNGEGKAITRIEVEGQKNLKGYVVSGDHKYKIGEDKQITITPNKQ